MSRYTREFMVLLNLCALGFLVITVDGQTTKRKAVRSPQRSAAAVNGGKVDRQAITLNRPTALALINQSGCCSARPSRVWELQLSIPDTLQEELLFGFMLEDAGILTKDVIEERSGERFHVFGAVQQPDVSESIWSGKHYADFQCGGSQTVTQITGIQQEGTRAQAEATVQFRPSELYYRLAKLLVPWADSHEGRIPAVTGMYFPDMGSVEHQQTLHALFSRYDDGWRMVRYSW